MQIRCYHCHKPFAIGREAVHQALDVMNAEKLSHYDAPCPHCRRVNRVGLQELARSAPDWTAHPVEEKPADG